MQVRLQILKWDTKNVIVLIMEGIKLQPFLIIDEIVGFLLS